eukprot:tig00000241_g21060.t2
MARQRRAKRARTAQDDAEGDAAAGESSAQSGPHATASNNVAAAPAGDSAVAGDGSGSASAASSCSVEAAGTSSVDLVPDDRQAKRARTAQNDAEGDAAAGESSAQSGPHATASNNVAAAPAGGPAAARDGSGSASAVISVEAAIAAGRSPVDVVPDDLVRYILLLTARWESDKPSPRVCKGHSPLEPKGGELDVSPARLAPLKAVCRRFRRLVDGAGEQARVMHVLEEPDNAAVLALARLPRKARAAVRRVAVREGTVTPATYRKLFSALRQQLEEYHLTMFSGHDRAATQAQFDAVAAVGHLSALRKLYVGLSPESLVSPGIFSGPSFLQPLSMLQRLSGLQELELNMPLPVSVLEGLVGPLAPSLRALTFEAAVRTVTPPGALFAVAGRLPLLERLDLSFFNEDVCKRKWPLAREADLCFLCALQHVKSLELGCNLDWLGFLESMPKLEHMTVNVQGDVDAAPVAAAKSLRSVTLSNAGTNAVAGSQPWSFLNAITGLKTLEALQLQLHTACFEHLAKTDLSAWGAGLSRLVVGMNEDDGATFPASLLKRLAADVPTLRVLETHGHCPLPVSTDLLAISRLSFLRELIVDEAVLEEYELGRSQREQLRGVLLGVRVTFKGVQEEDEDEDEEGEEDGGGDGSAEE